MEKRTRKNILITGGLGFIGFTLANTLLAERPEANITIVDNLSGTRLDWSPLQSHTSIHIQELRAFLEFNGADLHFDEIYHLASPVGSIGILEKSGEIAHDILDLAIHVARYAEHRNARLVYLSSSEVYGKDGQHSESATLAVPARTGARMEYALGKLSAEHLFLNRADTRGLDLRIVRPFNVVGANQSGELGFVLPKFIQAALSGTALEVYGDGSQMRSFCHVDDLVQGLLAVSYHGKPATVYNVGNPNNIVTIGELARLILDLTKSSAAMTHVDPIKLHGRQYLEAFNKIPDIRAVSRDTGWHPRNNLHDTLTQIIDEYQKPNAHVKPKVDRARAVNDAVY